MGTGVKMVTQEVLGLGIVFKATAIKEFIANRLIDLSIW